MIHLRSVDLQKNNESREGFPFNLQLVKTWQPIELNSPVTFFVGENGSGKSTLLESIATAAQMITVGSEDSHRDPTLSEVQAFSSRVKLVWTKRTRRGFFLRAEDFFGYVKRQNQTRREMKEELARVDEEYQGRSKLAQDLARMPFAGQLGEMQSRYGNGLDACSHGESFLKLFQSRFVPEGLYLLDEPEVPLSPLRQLALLAMLKDMVSQDAQFIIATHSPILMAYPEAVILNFDQAPIQPAKYGELEHVNLMRDFLNNPEAFLHHL